MKREGALIVISMRFPVLMFSKKHRTKDQLITPYSKAVLKITPKGKTPVAKYKTVSTRAFRNPDVLDIDFVVNNRMNRTNHIYLAIKSLLEQ
jgi:hypothetical protein